MKKLVFIIIPIFLFSCNQQARLDKNSSDSTDAQLTGNGLYQVDISNPGSNTRTINISDYCESVQYIPLETNEECLLNNILKVELVLPYLVLATTSRVFVFDIGGNLIRQIGNVGDGPGDYNSIADICVSKSDASIFIASIMNRRILHYSLDGELLASFSNPFQVPVSSIYYLDETIYCSFPDVVLEKIDKKIISLAAIDMEMNLKESFYSTLPTKENLVLKYIIPEASLYELNGKIRFKQVRNDTLYEVVGSSLIPALIFSAGDKKMTLEEFTYEGIKNRVYGDKYILFERMVETENDVFFSYKYNKRHIKSVFSKNKPELVEAGYSDSDYNLTDDLNYGLPFWPESFSGDGFLVGWLYPSELTEDQLMKIPCSGSPVSPDDNPVIQLSKLK